MSTYPVATYSHSWIDIISSLNLWEEKKRFRWKKATAIIWLVEHVWPSHSDSTCRAYRSASSQFLIGTDTTWRTWSKLASDTTIPQYVHVLQGKSKCRRQARSTARSGQPLKFGFSRTSDSSGFWGNLFQWSGIALTRVSVDPAEGRLVKTRI